MKGKLRSGVLAVLLLVLTGAAPVMSCQAKQEQLVLQSRFRAFEYVDYRTMNEEINSRYFYNRQGQCVREEMPDAEKVLMYNYHPNGNRKSESCYVQGDLETVTEYDYRGNSTRVKDAEGTLLQKCSNRYDAQGRLTERIEQYCEYGDNREYGGRNIYRYQYRKDGGYVYDCTVGHLSPEGMEIRFHDVYTYDENGSVTEHLQDVDYGMEVEYHTVYRYDGHGNVTESTRRTRENGQEAFSGTTYFYERTYNSQGRQVSVRISNYSEETKKKTLEQEKQYLYDEAGRLIEEETCWGGAEWSFVTTREYDEQGNLLRCIEDGQLKEENVYVPLSDALWEE